MSKSIKINTPLQEGRYKVIRQLGKGGFGSVFLAQDTRLKCEVALKQTLHTGNLSVRAFEREAKLLANLRHPSLPYVLDYFAENGEYFFVMEYIKGDDLEVSLRRHTFSFDEVCKIALQLFEALDYLHTQKTPIIHKDLKPANLKLTERGYLKVLDFGLSKGSAGLMSTNPRTVMRGHTPAFAPPEQLTGSTTDERSDLYSAAATLYFLVGGVTPPNGQKRAVDKAFGKPDSLGLVSSINKDVPVEFARILNDALAISPDDRPDSAEKVLDSLGLWQEEAEEKRIQEEVNKKAADIEKRYELESIELERIRESAETYYNLAIECRKQRDYDCSILNCTISIALNPNNEKFYTERGFAYDEKGDDEKAIKDCSEAIKINPNLDMAYNNRGRSLYKLGDYNKAITDYNKAIKLDSNNALYYRNRAITFKKMGDSDKAQADRQMADELEGKK